MGKKPMFDVMNEERAREILGGMIQSDNSLNAPVDYVYWQPGDETVAIDCCTPGLSATQLVAIAWWISNKN